MPNFLPVKWYFLLVSIIVLNSLSVNAQVGCGGFDGAPQPDGGVNSITNGTICLNAAVQLPANIRIIASNVADGNNPNNFAVVINWDDGSPDQVIPFGGAITVLNTGPHSYEIPSITHQFLPRNCTATAGRQCAYKPRVYLQIAGNRCQAEFGNPPDFFRFNTDDQCSGTMTLSETVSAAPVFEVCAGAATTVTFTDRTILNCLPPQELTGLNSTKRWRRFIYGTTNTITGGVQIGGVPRVFPFNAAAAPDESGNALTTSAPPFAINTTQTITIPATAQVGEEFHITMQYWNLCNQFTLGAAPVITQGIIRVVGQPTAPTPVNRTVCRGTNPLPAFSITVPGARSAVLWYRDVAGSPGAALTNPNGTNSTSLPTSAYPGGGVNRNTPGIYRVWASYRANVGAGSLLCESPLVPVTLTIREAIPTPGPITGVTSICNNNNANFSVPIPASAFPFGGATEYIWSATNSSDVAVADVTITPNSGSGATAQNVSATFNVNFTGTTASVVRRLRLRRQFSTAPNCQTGVTSIDITVYRATNAGTITGGDNKCQGETLAPIVWNASNTAIGQITRWTINNGGGEVNVGLFNQDATVDPTTLNLPAGNYSFRAYVKNGDCAEAATAPVNYIINPNPAAANAGPDNAVCIINVADPLTTNLTGNLPVGIIASSWSQVSGPGTASFVDASAPGTVVTVSLPGLYVFQWFVDNGSCQSQDVVSIRFSRPPAVPAPNPNPPPCGLTGMLAGAPPVLGEIVTWTFVSGPGTATLGVQDDITGSREVTVSIFGTYRFRQTFSTPCGDESTEVDVIFNEPATSLTEADKSVCVDGVALAPFAITGTIGGGNAGGEWRTSGSGTFTSSNAIVGSTIAGPVIADNYRPSALDYSNGSVTLTLRAIDADCGNVDETLLITFDRNPAAAAVGPDFSVCGTSAVLNATAPTEGGIGEWSVITVGSNIDDIADRLSPVDNLQNGANQFRWTVHSALGLCTTTNAVFTISKIDAPVANTLTPSDLCETNPNSATELDVDLVTRYESLITGGAPGVQVQWFTNPARTSPVVNPAQEDVVNNAIYYVRVSTISVPPTPVCSSDAVITFTVNSKPFVANLSPQRCEETQGSGIVNNINLNDFTAGVSLGAGNRTVAWFEDAALTLPVATPTDVDNIITNTRFFARVTNTITTCFNVAEVTFRVNPIPLDNPIVGPTKVCLDPNNVIFFKVDQLRVNHTYQWTLNPPGAAVNSTGIDTDFFILFQFPAVVPGGIDIQVVETSPQGCTGNPQNILVEVEDNPNSLAITGPSEVCEDEESVIFIADLFPSVNYFWTVPPGASIITQNNNEITVNFGPGSGAGDVTVTPSTSSGCIGTGTSIPVTINAKPVMAPNLDRTICSDELAATLILNTTGAEPAAFYNIVTRVNSAGLTQRTGVVIPPAQSNVADNFLTDQSFENITGGPLNVRYTVEPVSSKGCIGARTVVTLSVNPEPQLDLSLAKDLCSDEETGIILRPAVGSIPADQFIINSIINSDNMVGNNIPAIGVPLTNQAILANSWNNPGGGAAFSAIEYSITPRNSITGCLGDPPSTLQIRVFPKPIFEPITNAPICSGEAQNISLSTNNVPSASIVSTLALIDANITGASSNVYNVQPALINEVLLNTTSSTPGNVQYSIVAENPVNASKSCLSAPLIVPVQVNPVPVGNILSPLQVCSTVPNSGIYTATLANLEPLVTVATNSVLWFQDDPSVNASPIQILTPTTDVQHLVPIFAQITNASSCNTVVPVIHNVNNAVTLSLNEFDVTCNGAQNGRIEATAAFGTAPFSFRRGTDPFVTSLNTQFNFNSLTAGQYDITVMDSKGCMATVTSDIIVEPTPLIILNTTAKPVDCLYDLDNAGKNRNAEITVTASGGSGNYRFSLSPNNIQPTSVTASSAVFNNLNSGTYVIRVEEFSNSSCKTESQPVPLDPPAALEFTSVSVTTDPVTQMQISCRGAENGEIIVLAQGGEAPYNYFLAPFSGGSLPGMVNQQVKFDLLSAGNYAVEVIDNKGCKARATTNIRDVPNLFPGRIGSDQNICFSEAGPAGNAQELRDLVPVFGGSGIYEYRWEQSSDKTNWFDLGVATQNYDPDASSPFASTGELFYRRLVRSQLPVTLDDAPSFCADFLGQTDIITINVRPKPMATIIAPPFICKDGSGDVRLRLLDGTPPMQFDFNDGNGGLFVGERGGVESIPYPITNFQAPRNVSFVNIKDAFGCSADPVSQPIDILIADAAFTSDIIKCSGEEFDLAVTPQPGAVYVWNMGDGTTYTRDEFTANVSHTYSPSSSAQADANFLVKLKVTLGQCTGESDKTLTVRRSVVVNVVQPTAEICSGETVTFRDNSTGVTGGIWYYIDALGNRGPNQPAGAAQIPFQLINSTNENPLVFNIFYEPTGNPSCPVPSQQMQPISVYRTPDASFTANPVNPSVIGGIVTSTFTNTTNPIDDDDFEYEWDFDDVNAIISNDVPSGHVKTVQYENADAHEIVLTVKNKLNSVCRDTYIFDLIPEIGIPNLDFSVTRAACFPITLDITNKSANVLNFTWTLTSTNGTNEVSNFRDPDFRISQPGVYKLTLIGGRAPDIFGPVEKTIEVFDVPVADFDLRQTTVFLNQEVKPVNRSRYAQEYYWEFGDGFTSTSFEPRHFYTLEGRDSIMLVASFNHGPRDVDDDPATPAVTVVCSDTTKVGIRIIEGGALKIPNAFTPNVNGPNGGTPDNNFTNDVFLPIMEGVQEFNMQVYDRWGTLVFQSTDKNIGWDGYDRNGRLMPAGVYVFKVVLRLGDGQRTTKVGDVTLIR